MGKTDDMLDEIMADLGISEELKKSIRNTTKNDKKSNTDTKKVKVSDDFSTTAPINIAPDMEKIANFKDDSIKDDPIISKKKTESEQKNKSQPKQNNKNNSSVKRDSNSSMATKKPATKTNSSTKVMQATMELSQVNKNAQTGQNKKTTKSPQTAKTEQVSSKQISPKTSNAQQKQNKINDSSNKKVLNYASFILTLIVNAIFYGIAIFVIVMVCKRAYNFSYQVYGDVVSEKAPGREIAVEIKEGTSAFTVAKQLELNKIIVNKYSFLIRYELSEETIWPSTYTLSTSMNYGEILDIICDYDTAVKNNEELEEIKDDKKSEETGNSEAAEDGDKADSDNE